MKLKPIIAVIVLIVVASLSAAGCIVRPTTTSSTTLTPTSTPRPTPTPPGTQFFLLQGQQFSIALRSYAYDGGYRWQSTFDARAIALKSSQTVSDRQTGTPVPGAPTTQVFTYEALKAGTTSVMFSYRRSWETSAIDTTSFTVIVR